MFTLAPSAQPTPQTGPCATEDSHCESCGSTARQDLTGNDGYSKCCNELIVWQGICRGHHVR